MKVAEIRVFGLKDPAKLDAYFASSLVDVMAIISISPDTADIVADNPDHLRNREDREWLQGILQDVLNECGESQATFTFL
jgi:hypothetical protein